MRVLLLFNQDPRWSDAETAEVLDATQKLAAGLQEHGHEVESAPVTGLPFPNLTKRYPPGEWLVFNWCESIPGVPRSEPMVAEYLERMGYTFTGASAAALALAWDKRRVKARLQEAGIPTPSWMVAERKTHGRGWSLFPAIVKPVFEHASIGLDSGAVVLNRAALERRVAWVLNEYDQPALVEEFIDGREFHIPLWGNGVVEMLPPVEMDFSYFSDVRDRLCTYDSKFNPASMHYQKINSLIPAPLTPEELRRLEQVCVAAYRNQKCRDYARLDVRLRDGVFYVLDINPNADISPDASVACAAEYVGWSYGAMGARIVALASQRL